MHTVSFIKCIQHDGADSDTDSGPHSIARDIGWFSIFPPVCCTCSLYSTLNDAH